MMRVYRAPQLLFLAKKNRRRLRCAAGFSLPDSPAFYAAPLPPGMNNALAVS